MLSAAWQRRNRLLLSGGDGGRCYEFSSFYGQSSMRRHGLMIYTQILNATKPAVRMTIATNSTCPILWRRRDDLISLRFSTSLSIHPLFCSFRNLRLLSIILYSLGTGESQSVNQDSLRSLYFIRNQDTLSSPIPHLSSFILHPSSIFSFIHHPSSIFSFIHFLSSFPQRREPIVHYELCIVHYKGRELSLLPRLSERDGKRLLFLSVPASRWRALKNNSSVIV
jgi:hypothetical protein